MKVTIKRLVMKFPGDGGGVLVTATTKTRLLVGTVTVKDFTPGGCAEFARLFVSDGVRRLGVGRALIAQVVTIAKQGNATGISGYVKASNADALAFYEREGFLPIYRFHDGDHLIWRPL